VDPDPFFHIDADPDPTFNFEEESGSCSSSK